MSTLPDAGFAGLGKRKKIVPIVSGPGKDETEYPMNAGKRGPVLIFNHENFANKRISRREGSEHDLQALYTQFGRLGFDVRHISDAKKNQIFKILKEVANSEDKDIDCIVVVVMTHGGKGNKLMAYDEEYGAKNLWKAFNAEQCPILATKPKLFFIQACRGKETDSGARVHQYSRTQTDGSSVIARTRYKIPSWADFLIANVSFKGHYAWRSADSGSWFIQALCRELEEFGETKEICQILTRVNRRVAVNFASHVPEKKDVDMMSTLPDARFAGLGQRKESVPSVSGPGKDETEYPMNAGKRGPVLIFNHENFADKRLSKREGSEHDLRALNTQFGRLGFDVRHFNDATKDQIFKILKEVANSEDKEIDCIVVVIMTHGSQGDKLMAHDQKYEAKKLWKAFSGETCPILATKPKLFFIQACRGTETDSGARVHPYSRTQTDGSSVIARTSYTIPSWADFLIANATFEGHFAWRNADSGSWFIQALCRELEEFGETKEICQILTRVNRRVAVNYASHVPEKKDLDRKKEMPNFFSSLTRELYFRSKNSRETLI